MATNVFVTHDFDATHSFLQGAPPGVVNGLKVVHLVTNPQVYFSSEIVKYDPVTRKITVRSAVRNRVYPLAGTYRLIDDVEYNRIKELEKRWWAVYDATTGTSAEKAAAAHKAAIANYD
ncbi:hypothetical protein JCM5350_002392 [Sporobolomyces pararoseus]